MGNPKTSVKAESTKGWVKLDLWSPSSVVGSFSAILLYRGCARRPRKERILPEESSALRLELVKANVSKLPVNQTAIAGTTANSTNTTSKLSRSSRKSQSSEFELIEANCCESVCESECVSSSSKNGKYVFSVCLLVRWDSWLPPAIRKPPAR